MSDEKKLAMLVLALISLIAVCSIFSVRAGAIDQKAVVGLWLFDEGEGDIAGDLSGNGNDGSIVQSNWVDGKFGDAIEFTGSGYVEIPASESLNSIADEITIAAWIKFIDLTAWARIITRGVFQDKGNLQFILACTDQPEFVNLELHSKGQVFAIWTQHVLEEDAWHHIAYTSDGVQLKLYVDGSLKMTAGSGEPLNKVDDQSLFFGSGINDPGGAPGSAQRFKGALDEVAIYSEALPEDDVNDLMLGIQVADQPIKPCGKLATTWGNVRIAH